MRILYIIGTGGFAKEVAQLAHEINLAFAHWDALAYLSETPAEVGKPMPFGSVVGTDDLLKGLTAPADVAVGIGSPRLRAKLGAGLLTLRSLRFPNLVHPANPINPDHVLLGVGNIVTRGAVFTCDIKVGDLNVFNLNSTVGHDTTIGSFNVINPGTNVSGGVSIGDRCLFGTGSQVLEGISIASGSTIGAGAVVVKDVDRENLTLVGIPAKPLNAT